MSSQKSEFELAMEVPEIYALWGEPLLGPWSQLEPGLREAWTELARDVEQLRREA